MLVILAPRGGGTGERGDLLPNATPERSPSTSLRGGAGGTLGRPLERLAPVAQLADPRLESLSGLTRCDIGVKPVPLADCARKEGLVLIGVLFADGQVPVRVCAAKDTIGAVVD